jgi:Dolichyl-phosphate-mannose-protein mannosyltransferase
MAVRERRRTASWRQATADSTRAAARAGMTSAPADRWIFPFFVFVVHWLLVQIPASLAMLWGTPNAPSPPYGRLPEPMTGIAHVIIEPMRQWDGLWYRLIALDGYVGPTESARAAFWPLYPWLMDAGHRLTGLAPETIGYLISNIGFAVALLVLYRLVALDFGADIARGTLWAIALFPTAFFFSAVYTESLFLLLAVAALLAARTDRWWIAGIAGALAALTRSYGVFLGVPFVILLWQRHRFDLRRWFPAAIPAAFPILGPAIFAWFLQQTQGNWRAFIDVQAQWNRYQAMPWETLRCGIQSCFDLGGEPDGAKWDWVGAFLHNPAVATTTGWRVDVANSDTLELVVTILFLALAVLGLRLLPAWQSGYVLPGLLIPLFSPSSVHALMSMPRFVLPLFPLFTVLAILLRSPKLAVPAAVISSILLALLSIQFALWYWVS